METKHWIAITRKATADLHDCLTRFLVDAWHTYRRHPSLTGPDNNGVEVLAELLSVKVAMGINELHAF